MRYGDHRNEGRDFVELTPQGGVDERRGYLAASVAEGRVSAVKVCRGVTPVWPQN